MEIIENLDPLLKTFWYVAIPTTLIFSVQAIMTFLGVDSTDGLEADFDGNLDGGDTTFQLFSLRNLINFLLGFSWTGISFFGTINNPIALIIVSIIVGCLFVFLFFIIIKQVQKLEEDNSFKLQNTLDKSAEVYLSIPENKKGKGKIMISIKGTFHELEAMTEHHEKINSGTTVKVIKIENNIIIVQPI
ncbi:NfeD family protein [Flavobacterium seoulense]|uniref:Serine protease n=1 Tax=Flavobacterium seoulense TaxID=1492738 RepID=A0A066WZ43_9FLAO|nr:NfeD family protein [Flavobacterium seoulense]KDN55925.1 serine protease [Flavobacterium seoulense]